MRLKFYFAFIFVSLFAFNSVRAQGGPQTAVDSLVEFTSSNLPIVIINTHGQEILDDPKITVDFGIIANSDTSRNYVTDSMNVFNGLAGIEYRGSTSQQFPKKPYGFELRDELGEDLEASLLGMPKSEDWILYPSYNDKSLMRDALEYILGGKLGWYASRTRYCELVLNGEYQGIYILMESVKRGKSRVNVTKMDSTCISGDKVTGGYIIKLDKIDPDEESWHSQYPVNGYKREFIYSYPKTEDIRPEQKAYIKGFMDEFEDVMMSANFADTAAGYHKYINVNSFIDYMLLTELSKNVDGYRISTYMHKDRDSKGGKLTMGPLWDYNIAFGNCNYDNAQYYEGWQLDWDSGNPEDWPMLFWWDKLLSDPYFANKLRARWFELRQTAFKYENIVSVMDSINVLTAEARDRNFAAWKVLGVYIWPNAVVYSNYKLEYNHLKAWIESRLTWMDANMFGEDIAVADEPNAPLPAEYALEQNYPNPFNPSTVISYSLKSPSKVTLKIYDMLGKEVAMLVDEMQAPGKHTANFNAARLSAGVYFYSIKAGSFSETKKMVLLK
jgi:hypothetical protein